MSNRTDKIKKFQKNVLQRHQWDLKEGVSLANDFLQVSKIAEQLKETNPKAFNVFMTVLAEKIDLELKWIKRNTQSKNTSKIEEE